MKVVQWSFDIAGGRLVLDVVGTRLDFRGTTRLSGTCRIKGWY